MTKLFAASAFTFVLMMGIVNLFADMTYEGASSINGPFLGMLGASAVAIGIIAGVGEFLGYCLRFPAGYISDKTGKYWPVTFVGYAINLLAVPALALAGTWQLAGALVIAERIGRAIRKPSVEAMLSYTTSEHGKGWVYSVNNALDQTGATLGPLLMALVLLRTGNYRAGYAVLLVSAVLALATVAVARMSFPNPTRLETEPAATRERFTTSYWLFMLAGACIAAGLVSFELISYHFSTTTIVTGQWIPIFFAVAMATNAIASLFLGRTFDRFGIPVRIPYINAELVSREEIRAGIERMQGLWDYFVQTVHPGTIQLEGDTAVGRVYISEFGRMRDGRSELNYAIYHDRYQRAPDGWKFAERTYEVRYLDTTPLSGSAPHAAGAPANPPTENTSSTKGRR